MLHAQTTSKIVGNRCILSKGMSFSFSFAEIINFISIKVVRYNPLGKECQFRLGHGGADGRASR